VDRLDSWLNSQVGWRFAVLAWLATWPAGVLLVSFSWSLGTGNVPGLGLPSVEAVALSLPAAVPFAVLVIALRRWRTARHSNKPALLWRGFVGALFMMAAALLELSFTDLQSDRLHNHHVVWLVPLVLWLCALVFLADAVRRQHRLMKGAAPGGPR
jgi:hypothetical protein